MLNVNRVTVFTRPVTPDLVAHKTKKDEKMLLLLR